MDKRQLTIIGIAFAVVGLFLFGSFSNSRQNRSSTSGEYTPPDAPAAIASGDDLYKALGDRGFANLRSDLTAYGQLALPGENTASVSFTVLTAIEEEGSTVSFEGNFADLSNQILVKVEMLNNDKLKTSITNLHNDGNIDSRLPSNSKYNQFAGTLPFKNDQFSIEYNPSVDSFTITALTNDPNARQDGYDFISEGTGQSRELLKILFKPYLF